MGAMELMVRGAETGSVQEKGVWEQEGLLVGLAYGILVLPTPSIHCFVEPDQQCLLCCRLATGLDGMRIENKGRISTLTFFNVSEKDYGNYTCVATNKLGNTNTSITLYGECGKPGHMGSAM